MKTCKIMCYTMLSLMASGISSIAGAQTQTAEKPDLLLFRTLARQDSLLFDDVLNTCQADKAADLLTGDFQFLQDDGGPQFTTQVDRKAFLEHARDFCQRNNLADQKKVRRVVNGSLQLYLLDNNSAIQFGRQHFYAVKAGLPDQLVEVSRFVNTWRLQNGSWKLSRQFISQEAIHSTQPDRRLYDTISKMDSTLFTAINNRDLNTVRSIYGQDLEFYHDKGGLMNYAVNMKINEQNFAKTDESVRRELDPASLEVYPIKDYGAIEIGVHKFFTSLKGQPEKLTASPKFILIWRKMDGKWQVSRAISYGH